MPTQPTFEEETISRLRYLSDRVDELEKEHRRLVETAISLLATVNLMLDEIRLIRKESLNHQG